ncbi:MAG TPA: GNAT family N-acetyltransferase [Actinomycetota bacterium]|nr:GNAT family N-acetyltransferase [Actinomycetota bacterium]
MTRRVEDIDVRTVRDLPHRCRGCVFWELSPADRAFAVEHDAEFEKEAWCSELSLTWGAPGKIVYVDDEPAGFALAGPPTAFPRAGFFPAKVSDDALLLATMHVLQSHQGRGIGKVLIQNVLKMAKEHGLRAVECFADKQWAGYDCLIPAEFCHAIGFRIKRDHVRFPLMRIDIKALAKLAESFEAKLESFLESLKVPSTAPRPVR